MNADVRRKLDMAERVQVFAREHPAADPGIKPVFEQLDEVVARGNLLIRLQREGNGAAAAGIDRRRTLRNRLRRGLLHVIANIGQAAAEEGLLEASFKRPRARATDKVFLTTAESLVAQGRQHLDRLAKHGLTVGLLDEAAKLVEELAAATEQARSGRQEQVVASAELGEVARKVVDLVDRIDGFYRHRLVGQPELMAGWESARNVMAPARHASTNGPPAVPPAPGSSGAGGGIAAAA